MYPLQPEPLQSHSEELPADPSRASAPGERAGGSQSRKQEGENPQACPAAAAAAAAAAAPPVTAAAAAARDKRRRFRRNAVTLPPAIAVSGFPAGESAAGGRPVPLPPSTNGDGFGNRAAFERHAPPGPA